MLSATQVKALKPAAKARKVSDAHGLHLYVTPTGGKHWRLSYRHLGKQKTLPLAASRLWG